MPLILLTHTYIHTVIAHDALAAWGANSKYASAGGQLCT